MREIGALTTIILIVIVLVVILIFSIYLIYRSQEKKRKDLEKFSEGKGVREVPSVSHEKERWISAEKKNMDTNKEKSKNQQLDNETSSRDKAENKKKIMKYWRPKFHKGSKFFKYTSDGYVAIDANKDTDLKKWR